MKKKIFAVFLAVLFCLCIIPGKQAEAATEQRKEICWDMRICTNNGSDYAGFLGETTKINGKYTFTQASNITKKYKITKQNYRFNLKSAGNTYNGTVQGISGRVMIADGTYKWHKDKKGWWFGTSKDYAKKGFYLIGNSSLAYGVPAQLNQLKIYYFDTNGYMVSNQFRKGYWFGKNGNMSWNYSCSFTTEQAGTWYGDNIWWAKSASYVIDGKTYRFNSKGYTY